METKPTIKVTTPVYYLEVNLSAKRKTLQSLRKLIDLIENMLDDTE